MSNNPDDRDKGLNTLLDEIKQELLSYINRRLRLIKLDSFEKLSISTSILGYGLIVFTIVGTILFFLFIGIAFFIGELLNSLAAGFGIMALFSLLVLLIVFMLRKGIKKSILNNTIKFLRKIDANEE
ncbi:NfeD family protein [Dysgonomonas sp. BGC7]|uniref:NfeD family protein n=1 Tax=Dysgonomonas sp. BGC7 TaxID=1658008 RepID=UPI000680B380|nr:phage holin family protein [Dysgonomonas sp. BGC7]MBD8389463.1 phage holin family protein [Dysgonomonas sp. BGC7]